MNFKKILETTKKFEKFAHARLRRVAQQQLTSQAVAQVVRQTLIEMGELSPYNDEPMPEVKIWDMGADEPSPHYQAKANVGVYIGMPFPASVDSTLLDRLTAAFGEGYSFHIQRAGE